MNDLISSEMEADLKNSWGTDPDVFHAFDQEFYFDLDAAASSKNFKTEELYLTKENDALTYDWSEMEKGYNGSCDFVKTVWINPPYGRGFIRKFMDKCIEQKNKGVTSVMLVPATLDAQWLPISEISEIRIITGGRLSFYHPTTHEKVAGNTKGSMLVIFRPSTMPCFVRLIDRDEILNKVEAK